MSLSELPLLCLSLTASPGSDFRTGDELGGCVFSAYPGLIPGQEGGLGLDTAPRGPSAFRWSCWPFHLSGLLFLPSEEAVPTACTSR